MSRDCEAYIDVGRAHFDSNTAFHRELAIFEIAITVLEQLGGVLRLSPGLQGTPSPASLQTDMTSSIRPRHGMASRTGPERHGGDPGSPEGSSCYASDPRTPTPDPGKEILRSSSLGQKLVRNVGGVLM